MTTANGAEDDLETIAGYTITRWSVDQARRYSAAFASHFEALAAKKVRTQSVFGNWPDLQMSRCQHHYVFSLRQTRAPLTILAVLHENMDLPTRLRERLDAEEWSKLT